MNAYRKEVLHYISMILAEEAETSNTETTLRHALDFTWDQTLTRIRRRSLNGTLEALHSLIKFEAYYRPTFQKDFEFSQEEVAEFSGMNRNGVKKCLAQVEPLFWDDFVKCHRDLVEEVVDYWESGAEWLLEWRRARFILKQCGYTIPERGRRTR